MVLLSALQKSLAGQEQPPDLVVGRDSEGWWQAGGPAAHDLDGARTLDELFEIISHRHDPSRTVRVYGRGDPWDTTVRELQAAHGRDYRAPTAIDRRDLGRDPSFDFW